MEFVLGFLVAIVSAVLAYLAYRSQLNQSFKRIHYTSFMTALVLTRFGEKANSITVRHGGDDFISPVLCVARIENTGRAPILLSDFNGPLTIRHKDTALFRCGILSWNRPEVLNVGQGDIVKIDATKSGLEISPILLNPHDNITVIYVADAVPENWELEVTGRIAGIEKIIKLPSPPRNGTLFQMAGRPLAPVSSDHPPSIQPSLAASVLIAPVLASPSDFFRDQLGVFIDGVPMRSPHMVSIGVRNSNVLPMEKSAEPVITLTVPKTVLVKIDSVSVYDGDGVEQYMPPSTDFVVLDSHTVAIYTPKLDVNWGISVSIFASGDCTDLRAELNGVSFHDAHLMRLETDSMIEANLAQAEPRILLSNQFLYKSWHSLKKQYPWLERAAEGIRAFSGKK